MDRVTKIMKYEQGELTWEEIHALFQEMIDDGSVWKMQGSYQRNALYLISIGECHHV